MKKRTKSIIIGCAIGILAFIIEQALDLKIYEGLKNWFVNFTSDAKFLIIFLPD